MCAGAHREPALHWLLHRGLPEAAKGGSMEGRGIPEAHAQPCALATPTGSVHIILLPRPNPAVMINQKFIFFETVNYIKLNIFVNKIFCRMSEFSEIYPCFRMIFRCIFKLVLR